MTDRFLDKAYGTIGDTRDLYAAWAKSYDQELGEGGYATPARCAEALAKHSRDLTAPILDFGC
ncbi:MAG: methyltransferase type 11, partial [Lentibacter algarum]